jgi:hypothetical protein
MDKIDKIFKNKILTIPAVIFIMLGVVSAVIWTLSISYAGVADFFTHTISFALRFILTQATKFLPFSLAEIMLFASGPFAIFLLVRFIIKIIRAKTKNTAKTVVILKGVFRIVAFCGFAMFIFTFTLGVCYGKTPVNERMGFERRLLDADDLASALEILIGEISRIAGNIDYTEGESTEMPYDLRGLNRKLNEAYKNMLDEYDLFARIDSRVKPAFFLSEIMSRMHITGVYSFFTGEANVNIKFPDFSLVTTAAHEMAHLMGVGREDEANFVAVLVCLYSGDDYIRYSGLISMIGSVGGALFRADAARYSEIMRGLPPVILNEWAAYSRFFDRYRDTRISEVASAVNNTYLRAQGQEHGVRSYGFVVDLSVAYLIDLYKK